MGNSTEVSELQKQQIEFEKIDQDGLLRRNLGVESLEKELAPVLAEIQTKVELAVKQAPNIATQHVQQFRSALTGFNEAAKAQATHSNQEYIAQKDNFLAPNK